MPDNDSYHFTLIRQESGHEASFVHAVLGRSGVGSASKAVSVHCCFEAATTDVVRQLSAISSHSLPCSHGLSNIEGPVVRVSLGAAAVEGRVVRLVQRRVALQPLDQIWVG